MTHATATTIVALALIAWVAVAVHLARRAASNVAPQGRWGWPASVVALFVGTVALLLHPLPEAAMYGVACTALVIAGTADAQTGYLFDVVTLPAAILVLLIALGTGNAVSAVLGMAMLVLCFGGVVAVSRGRALGLGDVKAMAGMGAAFGPLESCLAIAAACVSGLVEASFRGRLTHRAEIRFGPHLAVGAAFVLVVGDPISRYVGGR